MSSHNSSKGANRKWPRKLRGQKAAVIISGAFLVTMLGPTLPTPLYPLYQQRLGFDGLMVTIIFATYVVGIAGALIVFGRMSDKFGRKVFLIPGLLLAFLSSLAFALTDSVGGLFLGRILSGLSVGIFTGTATAALQDVAPSESRRLYSLAAAMVVILGLGLGPVLAGAIAETVASPLALPYLVHMVLVVVAIVCVGMIAEPNARSGGPVKWELQRFKLPKEVRSTFSRAATAGFAGFSTLGLFASVAPALLANVFGITNHFICGLVVFVQLAFSAIGQISSTKMKDWNAMLTGTAILTIGIVMIGASIILSSLPLLLSGAAFAGVGQGMSFRASLAVLAVRTPAHQRGEVTSTFFLVLYISQAVPVIGVGFAAKIFGLASAGAGFALVVAVTAGAAFFSLLSEAKVDS